MDVEAVFRSEKDFYFGDQEESGLAIRVASPLRVSGGNGTILNNRGDRNGAEIWDVEVTTNRPDAMNHRGLAREAAVATGSTLRTLEFELPEDGEPCSDLVEIEIADDAVCSRFAARVVRGVRVGPSPDWLVRRLEASGLRSINVVPVRGCPNTKIGESVSLPAVPSSSHSGV